MKPWNRVQRREKFWAVDVNTLNASGHRIELGVTSVAEVCNLQGSILTVGGAPVEFGALSHAKIHRFDGAIHCWLANDEADDEAPDGQLKPGLFSNTTADSCEYPLPVECTREQPPNIVMLTYVWIKFKTEANSNVDTQVPGSPTSWNPTPAENGVVGDLPRLLLRDDIMRWGTVPVFGIVGRAYSHQSPGDGLIASPWAEDVSNSGQYFQGHVAKIPFPRVPKEGLNLRKGEALMCLAGLFPGPGYSHGLGNAGTFVAQNASRAIWIQPLMRMLCSN